MDRSLLDRLWKSALKELEARRPEEHISIWMDPTQPVSLEGGVLTLLTANAVWVDWIEENYRSELETILSRAVGQTLQVRLTLAEAVAQTEIALSPEEVRFIPVDTRSIGLHPQHTFDRYVVGNCNAFAHAAANSVAQNPSSAYNPLLIYGGTGLGKTHLMHAIGHEILRNHPRARVVYLTAEDFMNDMIQSLRHKKIDEFRRRYRAENTALLMDDIQFLSGKEATQEEFFHTFNALKNAGAQIVLTSDVLPRDIAKLEPRLRTRFEGGLLADIQAPDRETLLAILWQKSEAHGLRIPTDLAEEIADVVQGNIRELEGILNRVAAKSLFLKVEPTLAFARQHLPDTFSPARPEHSVTAIIEATARLHSLRPAEILGKSRSRGVTNARHIAMYLSRELTGLSFPELAREFGGKDQSTVQHGVKRIEEEIRSDEDLRTRVALVAQALGARLGKP